MDKRLSEALSTFAETFPSLKGAEGVRPFNPVKLAEWAVRAEYAWNAAIDRGESPAVNGRSAATAAAIVIGLVYDNHKIEFVRGSLGSDFVAEQVNAGADSDTFDAALNFDDSAQRAATFLLHVCSMSEGDREAFLSWVRMPWMSYSGEGMPIPKLEIN